MKYLVIKALPVVLVGASFFISFSFVTYAQLENITYPITELGGCESEQACKSYCDDSSRIKECVDFALRHNLMSQDEARRAQAFVDAGLRGPGGCQGHDQCEAYCSDISNIEECLAFAEQHEIMDPGEFEEAKKVRDALRRGVQLPPGCENERQCKETCERPPSAAVARQCFNFAKEAGLLPDDVDVEQAERAFQLIEDGTVGSFEDLEQCDRRDAFDDQVLLEKCLTIGEAMGVMSPEEAAFIRSTGGKGPGGCRGEECKTFCDNPENREECFRFTQEHPELIPERDRRELDEGRKRIGEALNQAPGVVHECILREIPHIQDIIDGRAMPSEEIGEVMKKCFSQFERERFDTDEFDGEEQDGQPPSGGLGFDIPPEVLKCVREYGFSVNLDTVPPPGFEDAVRKCFESMRPPPMPGDHDDFVPRDMHFNDRPDRFDVSDDFNESQFDNLERFRHKEEEEIRRHIEEDARQRIEEGADRKIEEEVRHRIEQFNAHDGFRSDQFPSDIPTEFVPDAPHREFDSSRSQPDMDPSRECVDRGGVWAGTTCEFSPQSSNPVVNFFAAIVSLFGVSY